MAPTAPSNSHVGQHFEARFPPKKSQQFRKQRGADAVCRAPFAFQLSRPPRASTGAVKSRGRLKQPVFDEQKIRRPK